MQHFTVVRQAFKVVGLIALISWTGAAQADFKAGFDAYSGNDYATALKEWKPLAEQGDADAQFSLGAMYDSGKGVKQDYAEAVKWYQLAAKQGHSDAQFNLGAMYDNGQGVAQNYTG